MKLSDFSDGYYGYCCTSELDGKEFILSQCFIEGTKGVGDAIRKMSDQIRDIPTIRFRYSMLLTGMELEMKGIRLTAKAPASSAIVKKDFGIRKGMSKKKTHLAFELLINLTKLYMAEGETHVR